MNRNKSTYINFLVKIAYLVLIVILLPLGEARASHWMGGEITWECQGNGQYVFQLKYYRDCNGSAGSQTAELAIWNHPSYNYPNNTIALNLISQTDISPQCNPVTGSPGQITCNSGGNGAVEEFVFQSNPVTLTGTPPAQGWIFTWDNAFRSQSIVNLMDPDSHGITLRAVMYQNNGMSANPCFDSSPQFAEKPATIVCAGTDFKYNHNAYDPDLDSLSFSFASPLDNMGSGVWNPPTNPSAIPFETGYSVNSPLPSTVQDPNNIPVSINPVTGEVSFKSYTQGTFVLVIKVESWKCGTLVAEVYREIQITILGCSGTNSAPTVFAPFDGGTSFDTVVYAGDFISFPINSEDIELLQDGSNQSNVFLPSGAVFGTGYTSTTTGCNNPPCATIQGGAPVIGNQGMSATFNWQTECSHIGSSGCGSAGKTYTFVLNVRDDFCPAPGISMPTMTITVLPKPKINAPEVKTASVLPNGDVELCWDSPVNQANSFSQYEVYYSSGGVFTQVGTITNINQTTFTHVGADAQNGSKDYYIKTISGCDDQFESLSDTISSIFLEVNNPGTGVAVINWNTMFDNYPVSSNGVYTVYMEYPTGVWNAVGSTTVGNEEFIDTIEICNAIINYRLEMSDANGCVAISSFDGDLFENIIPPAAPEINNVSVNHTTGNAVISWNQSPEGDVEGYIVFQQIGGNWIIVDTVYGNTNTIFENPNSNASSGSEIYAVAAFDSCWSGVPPAPNTSATGIEHNSIYVSSELNVCEKEVTLTWNNYSNWSQGVDHYEVYYSHNGGPDVLLGNLSSNNNGIVHSGVIGFDDYCYYIVAYSVTGEIAVSNLHCRNIYQPPIPMSNYLQNASVDISGNIILRDLIDNTGKVSGYRIEKTSDLNEPYEYVSTLTGNGPTLSFTDSDVESSSFSYYYKITVMDSCGNDVVESNVFRTSLLTGYCNDAPLKNILQWNVVEGWDGAIIEQNIYRSVDGFWDPNPIATVGPSVNSFEDDISEFIDFRGEFCYRIEAVESINSYGLSESSYSNMLCLTVEPRVYIPNAIVIGGYNNTFKPVLGYIDFDNYQLEIYNRLGQQIFITNDPYQEWDGTYKNKNVKEDVYVYVVKYKNAEGKNITHRGHVTVLKK